MEGVRFSNEFVLRLPHCLVEARWMFLSAFQNNKNVQNR